MKRALIFLLIITSGNLVSGQNLPDNPDPGKCYVKCITKDEFKDVEETIEVFPAYNKIEVVPAVYKTVEERVLVKEASKKFVYVPAVYETIDVSYVKSGGESKVEVVPASFGSDSRRFEIYPQTSRWEYKEIPECTSPNKEDCVYACYVEYPAQYRDIKYTTLIKDASAVSIASNSAKNATYKRRVVKTPASVKEIEIPAEYTTIKKRVEASPASTRKITVPARYETITRRVLTKKGGITTWEEVNCDLLSPTILPIFYQLDSARLTEESKRVIDEKLLPLLSSKAVSIEIMSHTDSRGNDDYNKSLSQQRANSVVNYLVSKGISRNRLLAKGYGETRLANRCSNGVECSESEHQKNRRTEFRVIEN